MTARQDSPQPRQGSEAYEIRVQGLLDARWADWVDGLTFTHEADGTTTLSGALADQPALHGVLNRMRDLGVTIISVQRLGLEDRRE